MHSPYCIIDITLLNSKKKTNNTPQSRDKVIRKVYKITKKITYQQEIRGCHSYHIQWSQIAKQLKIVFTFWELFIVNYSNVKTFRMTFSDFNEGLIILTRKLYGQI